MRLGHRHPRLHSFVLGSAAVHGLLLVVWASTVQIGVEPRAALSVRLEGERETTPAAGTVRATRPQAEHSARTPSSLAPPARATVQTSGGRETAHAAPPAAAAATGDDDEVRARIEARIRLDLARHFEYPYIARLRGWEGDVLLGFVVQASGRLDAVHVLRSSGFAVLDRSAVDSVRRIAHLPETVAWLDGRDLEVRLPIVYRLEGER